MFLFTEPFRWILPRRDQESAFYHVSLNIHRSTSLDANLQQCDIYVLGPKLIFIVSCISPTIQKHHCQTIFTASICVYTKCEIHYVQFIYRLYY